MGFLESSEEETLTPVCCVPRSNSPNFIVFVCVCVCVCACVCLLSRVCVHARVRACSLSHVHYLSIKWQEELLIFKIVSVLAFVISECKFKFIALCSDMFIYKLEYCA